VTAIFARLVAKSQAQTKEVGALFAKELPLDLQQKELLISGFILTTPE